MHSPPLTWLHWQLLKWILQVSPWCNGPVFMQQINLGCNQFLMCFFFFSIFTIVNWDTVWRASTITKFQVSTKLNRNVGLLRLFPGITAATVSLSWKYTVVAIMQVVQPLFTVCVIFTKCPEVTCCPWSLVNVTSNRIMSGCFVLFFLLWGYSAAHSLMYCFMYRFD